ncbi:MAG: hypothetical protein KC442_16055, partial [Thermomicrobiales bacterium]|nr:hypothetical protein [Thermomicrobiales bacterium]
MPILVEHPGGVFSGIPRAPAPLIGREAELTQARLALETGTAPCLTLSGPGGVGKTRLAIAIMEAAASQSEQQAIWLNLAPLTHSGQLVTVLARALRIPLHTDQPDAAVLFGAMQGRPLLLAIDNCEHLLPDFACVIANLLATCRQVQVIATSRAPLRIRAEQVIPVGTLPVPPRTATLRELTASPAVQLFLERAGARGAPIVLNEATGSQVAELCRALDGLPLAIELAASRVDFIGLADLATAMQRERHQTQSGPFDLPPRQRTINDTISWSYRLLSPAAQQLLRELSLFPGGFPLDATTPASGDAAADEPGVGGLAELIDLHLVQPVPDSSPPRFRMLETIRHFAQVEITDEERPARHDRLTRYILDLAEQGGSEWVSERAPYWHLRLDQELDNLRAAMDWLLPDRDPLRALRILEATDEYWSSRPYRAEALAWVDSALAAAPDASPRLRSTAHHIGVFSARALGLTAASLSHARRGLASANASQDSVCLGRAYYQLGNALVREDPVQAAAACTNAVAIFRERPAGIWLPGTLADLGDKLHGCGDLEGAAAALDEGLALLRACNYAWGLAEALGQRGHVALSQRDPALAAACFLESIAFARLIDDAHKVLGAIAGMAGVTLLQGDAAEAARLLGAVEAERSRTAWPHVAHTHHVARLTREIAAALGEARFASLLQEGSRIPFAEAETIARARIPSSGPV